MSWSKGAVVIVKHGDQEWADSMEQTLAIKRASDQEVEELRRDKKLSKIHDDAFTDIAIQSLRKKYRKIKPMPKWLDILLSPWSLLVYGIAVFSNKFLIIRDPRSVKRR